MNAVAASFNTTVRQMTEMSQRKKNRSDHLLTVLIVGKQWELLFFYWQFIYELRTGWYSPKLSFS